MSYKKELRRTVQCAKCPWKTSTNPHDIPDGYCEIRHRNLKDTIATPGDFRYSKQMPAMACHHSTEENMEHCVGWLYNQLGVGNNIGLRISMLNYSNAREIRVNGKQHERFEDTLPNPKHRRK